MFKVRYFFYINCKWVEWITLSWSEEPQVGNFKRIDRNLYNIKRVELKNNIYDVYLEMYT